MEKDNGFIKPREGDGRIGSGPSGGIKPEQGDCKPEPKPIQGD